MRIIALALIFGLSVAHGQEGTTLKKFDISGYKSYPKNTDPSAPDDEVIDPQGNRLRIFEEEDGYRVEEIQKDSPYGYYREYFKDGTLRKEVKTSAYGRTLLGELKTYDHDGQVITTRNFDDGYKISYERVLEICKERKVDFTRRGLNIHRGIVQVKQPAVWQVTWTTGSGPVPGKPVGTVGYVAGFTVDGVTGKVDEIPDSRPKK